MRTITIPITVRNLPEGQQWDEDGACWTAEKRDPKTTGCDWRWMPNNLRAFEKGEPDKEMFPFVPFVPNSADRIVGDGGGALFSRQLFEREMKWKQL